MSDTRCPWQLTQCYRVTIGPAAYRANCIKPAGHDGGHVAGITVGCATNNLNHVGEWVLPRRQRQAAD